jgi:glucan phosphoethanolaminetransferase (alkaline phosphatase superfamily)
MTYKQLAQNYNLIMLGVYYLVLYVFHWFFVDDSILGQRTVTMLFHLFLIFIAISAFFFFKADTGAIEKKHISKDRDISLVG